MVNGINKFVAKYGDWIFLGVAVYKFVYYILDLVQAFKHSGGSGAKYLFSGLFDMFIYLVFIAIVIWATRKITGIKGVSVANTMNGGNTQQNPQYPAQQMPQNPAQNVYNPVAPTAPAGVWYCAGCGTQNSAETTFCSNCGKPKQ